MVLARAGDLLSDNIKILKSEASKAAYQGVLIAVASIVIATCLVSFYASGNISLQAILSAQKNNIALWVLDGIPFVFGLWGQYSSSLIVHHAGVMIFDQTQELRNKADNLERHTHHINTHDQLTDLPNRALFYDRVEQAILAANHQNSFLSIVLIEIQNFKDIYDTLGRISSDLILKQVSKRLQGVIHEKDSVARIDGPVFGILLTDIAYLRGTKQFASYIQKAMELPFVVERLQVVINCNIGIVHFPKHGEDVDTLVQKAGIALHIAQNSNKGYALYEPSFDKHSPQQLTLMSELRLAMERGGLELYYQPKVSIQTGKLYGAEALLHWEHPKQGLIAPDKFIATAEQTRMINHLTVWLLTHAFRDCADWHKQGVELKIAVNLSARMLHDPDFPDLIAGIAAAADIKPEWIILEIAEGAAMREPERTMEIIELLHGFGYQFSINNFGTGYSSLAYLKKMPLTELTIDRSFVTDITTSENDAVIAKATINLAHNLGLQVTAEGVESEEVLAMLKEYGCDVAQGDYFSKPLAFTDFNLWMNMRNYGG